MVYNIGNKDNVCQNKRVYYNDLICKNNSHPEA